MERITGIGGAFFRAKDPAALAHWYSEHLGIDNGLEGEVVWQQQAGPTVFAPFESDTDYFRSTKEPAQQVMLNFRVRDLDAMLPQLRAAGVDVDDKTQTEPSVGKFGWATDPEGNRFELWQPDTDGHVRPERA